MYGALNVWCFKLPSDRLFLQDYIFSLYHVHILMHKLCVLRIVFRYKSSVWLRLSATVWWKCKASNMFKIQCTLKLIAFELVSIADMCAHDNCGWVFILSGISIIWRLKLSYLGCVHFEWHLGVCGVDAFWRFLNAHMRQKMWLAVQWDSDSVAAVTCKLWRR